VAIYRFLQQSAFEPDDIERMSAAYESALKCLELKDRNDPLTEIIAKIIIEVAQSGEKHADRICAIALSKIRGTDREAC